MQQHNEISPQHYEGKNGVSAKNVINAYGLTMWTGNCVKYIIRAGSKPGVPAVTDLAKAQQNLRIALENPEEWRTYRIKEIVPDSYIARTAPRASDVQAAFDLSDNRALALDALFKCVEEHGDITDKALGTAMGHIEAELKAVQRGEAA